MPADLGSRNAQHEDTLRLRIVACVDFFHERLLWLRSLNGKIRHQRSPLGSSGGGGIDVALVHAESTKNAFTHKILVL